MSGRGRASPLRRVVRWAWLVAVLAALGFVLVDRWDEIGGHLAAARPAPLVGSALMALLGVGLSGVVWRALLAGLGASLPWRAGAGVFFVGQLGKYLPGSVWPVLAQAELGRDHDVPARVSLAAVALFMLVHLATGVAVAALALPAAGVAPWPVTLLAAPAVAILAPGLQQRLLATAMRLLRRDPLPSTPDAQSMARAGAWALAMWGCYAAHLGLASAAMAAPIPFVLALGVFAFAWSAGFVMVLAPAGAGAREAAMVWVLLPALPAGGALAVMLASRLLVTLADLAWGLGGLALRRRVGH